MSTVNSDGLFSHTFHLLYYRELGMCIVLELYISDIWTLFSQSPLITEDYSKL